MEPDLCDQGRAHVLVVSGDTALGDRLSGAEVAWRVTTRRRLDPEAGEPTDCLVVDARTLPGHRFRSIASRARSPVLAVVSTRSEAVYAIETGADDVFVGSEVVEPTLLEARVRSVLGSPGDRVDADGALGAASNPRERELGHQRERLAVLHRVLRHDVRTSANLLLGTADFVRERVGDPGQRASEIEDVAMRIARLSDTVRRLTDAVGDETPSDRVDLSALLDSRVESLTDRFPAATVRTSVRTGVVVETEAHLEAAFDHLLENAVVHTDDSTLGVDLAVDAVANDAVVTIRDDGPGIPADELAVIGDGIETPLDHSSGLGLWVSTWIVDAAGGSIAFDSGEAGTTVTVRLSLAVDADGGPAGDSVDESTNDS